MTTAQALTPALDHRGGREGRGRGVGEIPASRSVHSRGPDPSAAEPAAQPGGGGRAARAVRGEAHAAVRRAQDALRSPCRQAPGPHLDAPLSLSPSPALAVTAEGGVGLKTRTDLRRLCVCAPRGRSARSSPPQTPTPAPGRGSKWPWHSRRPANRVGGLLVALEIRQSHLAFWPQTAAGTQSARALQPLHSSCRTRLDTSSHCQTCPSASPDSGNSKTSLRTAWRRQDPRISPST